MRQATLLVAAIAGVVVGCATINSTFRSKDEERFDAGIRALAASDYETSHRELAWVAEHYAHQKSGQRALLVLAALEMDPRNPSRRTGVGTDLAAGFLRLSDRDAWTDPLAQTLYLLGLELGAAEERAMRAEREAEEQQKNLPTLPGLTVNARIRVIEQERDRLARRVTTLEEQLAEKDRELERIRKTIKP